MQRIWTPFLALLMALFMSAGVAPEAAAASGKVKKIYAVKRGDSLSKISRKLSVSQKQLRWWNPVLKHANALRPGRRLFYFVKGESKKPALAIRKKARKGAREDVRPAEATKKRATARKAPVKDAKVKEAATKRPASKQTPGKKTKAKRADTKRVAAKKAAAKRASAKKAAAKRASAKKAAAKRAAAKKATAKRTAAQKSDAIRAAAEKVATKRAASKGKRAASKLSAASAKGATTKRSAPKKAAAKRSSPDKEGAPKVDRKRDASAKKARHVSKAGPTSKRATKSARPKPEARQAKVSGPPQLTDASASTEAIKRSLGIGKPSGAPVEALSAARGIDLLQWMGRADRRMPSQNPTPDLLLDGRTKAQAEVIGSPNRGKLKNAVQLPLTGPGFRRINRSRTFACDQTIALIRLVGKRLLERYPGTQPLLVGALSHEKGGRAGGHRSHQNGLDVDIAYFEKGNPYRKHYKSHVRASELDYEKNWFVFETLILTGKVNYIFVDRRQLPHFRDAARRAGWSEPALKRIFGDENFRGGGRMIRHWKGHSYHAHIRFTCPRSDERCEHSRY